MVRRGGIVNDVVAWLAGSGIVQGVIIGATFAYLTTILVLNVVAKAETRTVNGWSALPKAGRLENGLLVRAATQKALPVVNVFEESAYWTTVRDVGGERLTGKHAYRLHFPPGQLPPADAFWSLTATDTAGYVVETLKGRPSIDSHTGLVENADGSIDILLQRHQPPGGGQNWLASPPGRFKLMLRAYLPGAPIVDGDYAVPPVTKAAP